MQLTIARVLLILAPFSTTIYSYGQESFISIRGKLSDSKSKEAIPYASIYIQGKSIGTTSNEDGNFLFHLPIHFSSDTLIISAIGYESFKSVGKNLIDKDNLLYLKPTITLLKEVVIKSSDKRLTAKDIVKKAVANIPQNYPMQPFVIEGFFRDLQIENGKYVELLEAATRFSYKNYNPGYEEVQVLEVRRSYNKRHPLNGKYDRQNSIVDLMEDNYVKHRFGPIEIKGWKFKIDSMLSYNERMVYKINGSTSPSENSILYIDIENFSILKLELSRAMQGGEPYKRYLNYDSLGMQETSFKMVFEFQEFEGKMYLKYQREEDAYYFFKKRTSEIVLRQSFIKELFVNNVITKSINGVMSQGSMNINQSVEIQAKPFNENFWKHYNAPVQTLRDSKIIQELQGSEFKKGN
jgi:CarboxypepD_reg-like domain